MELAVWNWRRPNGLTNFGDELGPEILSRLGYKVRRVSLPDADIVTAGSVLETVANAGKEGTMVWGSGLMHARDKPIDTSNLDIRAVRGHLTAKALGKTVPVGDPGSLVPHLWNKPKARFRLGVVRHYVDTGTYPDAGIVIDAGDPVDEVLYGIGSCSAIASSSLHGLIVATAWGIPAVRLPNGKVAGGDFKWIDWVTATDGEELTKCLP